MGLAGAGDQRGLRAAKSGPMTLSSDRTRSILGFVMVILGVLLISHATISDPLMTPANHWSLFVRRALSGLVPLLSGLALARAKLRSWVALFVGLLVVWAAAAHQVCDPIPESERAGFEAVSSLADRARAGEPFRQFAGQWYQCKSAIARAAFF